MSDPARRGNLVVLPLPIKNWLTAKYLNDPTPGLHLLPGSATPEPVVIARHDEFLAAVGASGLPIDPTLFDAWVNAGWILDMMVEVWPAEATTSRAALKVARIGLGFGEHRAVGIRRAAMYAPTDTSLTQQPADAGQQLPQGPYAPNCFRLESIHATGIGSLQWSLLDALWDRAKNAPSDPRSGESVWRCIHKRKRFSRINLRSLKNDTNKTLHNKGLSRVQVEWTARQSDMMLMTIQPAPSAKMNAA